jgi:predicted HTH transcriptional regulator
VRKMSEETKEEKREETRKVTRKDETEDFEVLAEWTVRRLRPLQDVSEEDYPERVKRWVIYSLGLDKLHQDIFLHLEKNFRSTTTDIATQFDISPNTARKYLDELHTVGLTVQSHRTDAHPAHNRCVENNRKGSIKHRKALFFAIRKPREPRSAC